MFGGDAEHGTPEQHKNWHSPGRVRARDGRAPISAVVPGDPETGETPVPLVVLGGSFLVRREVRRFQIDFIVCWRVEFWPQRRRGTQRYREQGFLIRFLGWVR